MGNVDSLQLVNEGTWFSGHANMWHKESKKWWGNRFGLWQIFIWILIINGITALLLIDEPPDAVLDFIPFASVFSIIGAVILAQGTIVGEKQSGTAAWVLSAPVSRSTFLLSKLIALVLGCLTTMIVLPYAIAYLEFSLIPEITVPFTSFLIAMGVSALHLGFYICLTLMLGTLFTSRGPVIGIPLAAFFIGSIIQALPLSWLSILTPWPLIETSAALVHTQSMGSLVPVIATAMWSVIFIALAIWRFRREEF
ncbi:ABC transporter permease [Chloroflexota bacterium]